MKKQFLFLHESRFPSNNKNEENKSLDVESVLSVAENYIQNKKGKS